MQEIQTRRPATLPGLTGLRGVGALWVVLYHAQGSMGLPIAQAGYLGVDLFFILSGFVLSHAYPDMRWNWPSYRAFLRARFARIFPMHWAALAVVALVLVLYPGVYADMPQVFALRGLFASIPLMQNWGFGRPGPWNGPAWSLSTEWLVSLAFPLFVLGVRRVATPLLAALLCAASLVAFEVFLVLTHNPSPALIGRAGVVRTVCEFAAGCLLYRVYAARMKVSVATVLIGALLILAGLLVPAWAILAVFGFPVVILLASQSSGPVKRVLSTPKMMFIGEISFSLYLLHWILLIASNRLQASLRIQGLGALLWFCCFLGLVIALSAGTYHLIEVPARRWLRGTGATRSSFDAHKLNSTGGAQRG
jgi:peptidoglycan/LPS O-acetylase OafA/YrhL